MPPRDSGGGVAAGPAPDEDPGGQIRVRLRSGFQANVFIEPAILLLTLLGSAVVIRFLGPEGYAVVAAVLALSTTIIVLFDLGLTRSYPKILPDVSVRFGSVSALLVFGVLARLKLLLVSVATVALFVAWWHGFGGLVTQPDGSRLFIVLVALRTLAGTALATQQAASVSALHTYAVARVRLFNAVVEPIVAALAAVLLREPYVIVLIGIISEAAQWLFLRRVAPYDLAVESRYRTDPVRVSIGWVLRRYRAYLGATYILFLFNRFVYGLPLTLWMLSLLGVAPVTLGNAALAVAIIHRGWDMANLPLANLRAPLLALLHSQGDRGRFMRVQRVMVGVVVVSSGLLAVGFMALGHRFFDLLYGRAFVDGVAWGVAGLVVGMVANMFSLGNSTLHQTERYSAEMLALCASGLVIAGNFVFAWAYLPMHVWAFVIILGFVGARAVFWLATDLWVDATIFRWQGSVVKLRGLAAVVAGFAAAAYIGDSTWPAALIAGLVGASLFLLVFRGLGGIGGEARESVGRLIPQRIRWMSQVI